MVSMIKIFAVTGPLFMMGVRKRKKQQQEAKEEKEAKLREDRRKASHAIGDIFVKNRIQDTFQVIVEEEKEKEAAAKNNSVIIVME